MVRYGDQEQSSPGGTIPRISQAAARREAASAQDGPAGEEFRQDAQAAQDAQAGNDTLTGWDAGFYWEAVSDQGYSTDGSRGAQPGQDAPGSSAAGLRELAELADLLTELGGLVYDLGMLIVGLMATAAGAGERQVRTVKIPPELAELATAHQELKTGQQALTARFAAARGQQELAGLRGSLAALTERATRAVSAAAAAAVIPQEGQTSGRPAGGHPAG